MGQIELAKTILDRFKGRTDHFAFQREGESFKPHPGQLTPEKFAEAHLGQQTCLGFYLTSSDDTCWCSCIDADNHNGENPNVDTDTKKITDKLDELGFDDAYLVERSQSGTGFHVWIIHEEPLSAALVRRFWKQILTDAGVRAEIYPKQDSLKDTSKGLGNLVRYPLWNQSEFVQWWDDHDTPGWIKTHDSDYHDREIKPAIESLTRVSCVKERELENCVQWFGEEVDAVVSESGLPLVVENLIRSKPDSLLARRWMGDKAGLADKSLSAVALSLVHELVRSYISPTDIATVLNFWAKQTGYNKATRSDWQRITIQKAYDVVAGRTGKRLESRQGGTICTLTKGFVDAVIRGDSPTISTGIDALDESLGGGLGFGEMTIIAARPSHGKSAVGLHLLDHAATLNYPGLFCSLEMTVGQTSQRYASRIGLDVPKEEWGTDGNEEALKKKIEAYWACRSDVYFEGDCNKWDQLDKTIREYVEEKGVRVVVVDYIGCVQGPYGDEFKDLTHLSPKCKSLAKELNIVLIILAQFNRNIDKEDMTREPRMADIRGSGQIEADSDVILFPRWPFQFDGTKPKNDYYIWVGKNRNRGIKTKQVLVHFEPDRQTFR